MSTIFVAGVYGVGKSTLCNKLSEFLRIPFYSAGDLISEVNGEKFGPNKVVKNKNINQDILSVQVNKKMEDRHSIILAGHFCIFDKSNSVEKLPNDVFNKLQIEQIILLEADVNKIIKNLNNRDNKNYTYEQITNLMKEERNTANKIASYLRCCLYIHQMAFDKTDEENCLKILTRRIKLNESSIRH